MNTPIVSVEWLQQNFNDPDLVILDASMTSNKSKLTSDHEGFQIKNARIFDIKNKFSDTTSDMPNTIPSPAKFEEEARLLGINENSKIVVYDKLGIYTSPRAWWLFRTMGHDKVAVLDGGLPDWAKNGFDIEPIAERKYSKGDFKAKPDYTLFRKMEDVVANLTDKESLVLDARSEGRFCGTAPEPRAGLSSGHMPNALSLPWTKVVEDRKMKSKEELKKVFEDLKVQDQPLIFSCGSGITACIIMLAAELVLENDKAVYDGSWTEWAQLQEEYIVNS